MVCGITGLKPFTRDTVSLMAAMNSGLAGLGPGGPVALVGVGQALSEACSICRAADTEVAEA